MKSRYGAFILVLLTALAAFYVGQITDQADIKIQVADIFKSPTSTPTPDTRLPTGQLAEFGDMQLRLNKAYRFPKPGFPNDLFILEVTFFANPYCRMTPCQFDRQKFTLITPEGKRLSPAAYPHEPIPQLKLHHLVETRILSGNTSETGQIYFLASGQYSEFTLEYQPQSQEPISFVVTPEKL